MNITFTSQILSRKCYIYRENLFYYNIIFNIIFILNIAKLLLGYITMV